MVNNTALANLTHNSLTNSSLIMDSKNINDSFREPIGEERCMLQKRNEALAVL